MKRQQHAAKKVVAVALLALFLWPGPSFGDIAITQQAKQSGFISYKVVRRLLIKGLKMRVEWDEEKETHVTLYDLETGQRVRLNPQRKEAFVIDLASVNAETEKYTLVKNVARVVTATGKKSEIAGSSCDVYTFDLKAPMPSARAIQHDHGTICVSQNIPGGSEFTRFVIEAKKRGFAAAAAVCSPSSSSIGPYFYRDEPNVMVLSAEAESEAEGGQSLGFYGLPSQSSSSMHVTAISTDLIPDDQFKVPTDWKIRKDILHPNN